jgi:glutamyl-Q tRNA(Asp) synthetase
MNEAVCKPGTGPTATGRFAPSPTGPLHYGSLLAALASYLNVRSQAGRWLVRMEDIDPPREIAGAADDILRTLEYFHLYWDGEVMYQSTRDVAYRDALDTLSRKNLTYPCTCTRREIRERGEPVYQGHCRAGPDPDRTQHSIRIRTEDGNIGFTDLIQGARRYNLSKHAGDFIIRRADTYIAYQLAVVIDDAQQQITEVIRGADLLESTPHQLYLQHQLGLPRPRYGHIPLAVNADGIKLSKQTGAHPVSGQPRVPVLIRALDALGQQPTEELYSASVDEVLEWAIRNWSIERVKK